MFATILARIWAIIGLAVACLAGLVWYTIHMRLYERPGTVFLTFTGLWILVWILSSLVLIRPSRVSRSLLFIVIGWMLLQVFTYHAPAIAEGAVEVVNYGAQKLKRGADKLVTETRDSFNCDSSNWKSFKWFGTAKKDGVLVRVPNMWYTKKDGRIVCSSGPGYDSLTGEQFEPVTQQVVLHIARQEPPPPPPTPKPVPTPLPILASSPPSPSPVAEEKMGAPQYYVIR